jgi:hypothetical protein
MAYVTARETNPQLFAQTAFENGGGTGSGTATATGRPSFRLTLKSGTGMGNVTAREVPPQSSALVVRSPAPKSPPQSPSLRNGGGKGSAYKAVMRVAGFRSKTWTIFRLLSW